MARSGLWNGKSGQPLRGLANQGGTVGRLAFKPDGKRLLSTCGGTGCNTSQRVWDVATGKELLRYTQHDNTVVAAAISTDDRWAATGGGNNNDIHIWDLTSGTRSKGLGSEPLNLGGTGKSMWATGYSADGNSIAWGSTWSRHDPANGYGVPEFQLRLPSTTARLGQPERIAPGDATNPTLWRRAVATQSGMSLAHRKGGNFGYDSILDVSRDGKTIASIERGSTDGLGHWSYTFAPDGRSIVSGGGNGKLHAYGLDGKKLGEFVGHEGVVWAVTPSPDGRTLLSSSDDQTVRLWNLATRELIVTLFHGRDGEWVMWTPQGYFTGSPGAGHLVGWQQNHGPDKEATYVKAIQLRHLLNRPDIVERAIVLADAKAAVAELAGTGPTLAELVRSPPPHVHVAGDITSSTGKATLVLEVERTSRTVDAWDVHLGDYDKTGPFVAERKLAHRVVPVPAGYKPRMENRDLLALEVNLRRGTNVLGVVARTAVGETPMSVTQIISTADALGDRQGTLRILAVGIDRYPNAAYPGNLTLAGKDARDFAATATKEMGRRHDRTVVDVMFNGAGGRLEPTKANIEAALRRLAPADKSDKDTVVLFLAGHGESRRGQYVLLPTDFRRRTADDMGDTVVEWQTIRDALGNASGQRIVFLDTCHAGNAYNDQLGGDARGFQFAAFTGAKAGNLASEDRTLDQGRFTHAVKSGLEGGALRNNRVDVYGLGPYIADKVVELSNGAQEAEFWPGGGNFVLVQR